MQNIINNQKNNRQIKKNECRSFNNTIYISCLNNNLLAFLKKRTFPTLPLFLGYVAVGGNQKSLTKTNCSLRCYDRLHSKCQLKRNYCSQITKANDQQQQQ